MEFINTEFEANRNYQQFQSDIKKYLKKNLRTLIASEIWKIIIN